MQTFDLTEKEMAAARIFVQTCLDGMGGKRPGDLEYDEYTWIDANDLIQNGYTRHEAAGLMSSLAEKGFIEEFSATEWVVATEGWRWMDTVWEDNSEAEELPEYRVEGDLYTKDCTDWLQDSELAHDDETLFLNWRIVNREGRTMVAFAGGASYAIAEYVCKGLNEGKVFK